MLAQRGSVVLAWSPSLPGCLNSTTSQIPRSKKTEDACGSSPVALIPMVKAVASSVCMDAVLAGRLLPLEILPAGQFDPLYRLPISVSGVVYFQSLAPDHETFQASTSSVPLSPLMSRFKRSVIVCCVRSALPVPCMLAG